MTTPEQLLDAIEAVPEVAYCNCSRPLSEHSFYNDRIYDVQGHTCPGAIGGEFRFNAPITTARHRQAKIDAIAAALGKDKR